MPRLLLVDDDADLLDALETWLGREHEVWRAAGVSQAMAMIAEGPIPDLVLTDWEMGRHNADELLGWLAIGYPQVRRLLYTGTPREHLDGAGALAHRVLVKGCPLEEVSEAVADFFRRGRVWRHDSDGRRP
jgi:DNA-binding NtrC family response regulator